MTRTNPAMQGFYKTRGVVTFNDRVFRRRIISSCRRTPRPCRCPLKAASFQNRLQVGPMGRVGRRFGAGQKSSGHHATGGEGTRLACPARRPSQPLAFPARKTVRADGANSKAWCIRSIPTARFRSSGRMARPICGSGRPPSNSLAVTWTPSCAPAASCCAPLLDAPLLLCPSRHFVDVEEAAAGRSLCDAPERRSPTWSLKSWKLRGRIACG